MFHQCMYFILHGCFFAMFFGIFLLFHFCLCPRLVGGFGAGGPPGIGFGGVSGFVSQDDYDIDPSPVQPLAPIVPTTYYPSTTAGTTTTTAGVQTFHSPEESLTLADITWISPSDNTIRLNETDYMIARNATVNIYFEKSEFQIFRENLFVYFSKIFQTTANEGFECIISSIAESGHCHHLQACVLPAFTSDKSVFTNSYFCEIKSSSTVSYAGVCCPSSHDHHHLQEP